MIFRAFRTFALAIAILNLQGCTLPGSYYFRNLSSDFVKVTLAMSEDVINIFEEPTFTYGDDVLEINRTTIEEMTKSIPALYINKNLIQLSIPPKSTLLFATGSNTHLYLFKWIVIENRADTIYTNQTEKLNLEFHQGSYTGYIDISNP